MIEDLKQLIDCSTFPTVQKRNLNRFVDKSVEYNNKFKNLIYLIGATNKRDDIFPDEIILSTDDVVIYTVEENSKDKNTIECPYRFIYKVENNWKTSNVICPDFQICYLSYLQEKHLGQSSDFVYFVNKMLSKNENL